MRKAVATAGKAALRRSCQLSAEKTISSFFSIAYDILVQKTLRNVRDGADEQSAGI